MYVYYVNQNQQRYHKHYIISKYKYWIFHYLVMYIEWILLFSYPTQKNLTEPVCWFGDRSPKEKYFLKNGLINRIARIFWCLRMLRLSRKLTNTLLSSSQITWVRLIDQSPQKTKNYFIFRRLSLSVSNYFEAKTDNACSMGTYVLTPYHIVLILSKKYFIIRLTNMFNIKINFI